MTAIHVVVTPAGFTETFDEPTIKTLLRLGLIRLTRMCYLLHDGDGNGVGALHKFYASGIAT